MNQSAENLFDDGVIFFFALAAVQSMAFSLFLPMCWQQHLSVGRFYVSLL